MVRLKNTDKQGKKSYKFFFQAFDKIAEKKISGNILAWNKFDANNKLINNGLNPIDIRQQSLPIYYLCKIFNYIRLLLFPLSETKLSNFTLLVSSLLNAGIPFTRALILAATALPARFRYSVSTVVNTIESGSDIYDAFLENKIVFGEQLISLLARTKNNASLNEVFADYNLMGKSVNLTKVILFPLIPIVVILFIILLAIAITGSGYFAQLLRVANLIKIEIGSNAVLYVKFAKFLVMHKYQLLITVISLPIIIKILYQIPYSKRILDFLVCYTPLLSKLVIAKERALFFSSIDSYLRTGTTIQNAIAGAALSINNTFLRNSVYKTTMLIKQGETLGVSLKYNKLLKGAYANILKISAESQNMHNIIKHLKNVCSDELSITIKFTSRILMSLVLALTIGLALWALSGALLIYVSVITFLLSPTSALS